MIVRGASTAPASVRSRMLSATGRSVRFGTRMIAAASAAVVGAASTKVTIEPMSDSGATCNRIRPGGSPGSEGSRSGAPGASVDGTRTTQAAMTAPAKRRPAASADRNRYTNRPGSEASRSSNGPNGIG